MRQLAKRILPSPFQAMAYKIYMRMNYRKRPRFTTKQYEQDSILQCCIAYNRYGGYCIPLSSDHRPAAQKILAGAVWEPNTIDFLMSHLRDNEGDIIHAGTYFGDFLPALSQACSPYARIWAFEPNPENYTCALITSYINGLRNVELTNAGLGERKDSLAMVTTDSDGRGLGGASRLLTDGTKNASEGMETVQIVAVDEVIPSNRRVSIIQLDVEFYEEQALSGALETIRRCLPVLFLENLPEDNWLSEHIWPLGYQLDQIIHGNTVLTPHQPRR